MTGIGVLASQLSQKFSEPDTPETRNAALISPDPGMPPFPATPFIQTGYMVEQVLEHLHGDIATGDHSLRPRIVAVPGPGCTLRGLARKLIDYINSATPRITTVDLITVEECARALFVYSETMLGKEINPIPMMEPLILNGWQVGVYLAIPIELDRSINKYVTNLDQILQWASQFDPAEEGLLDIKCTELEVHVSASVKEKDEAWIIEKEVEKFLTTAPVPGVSEIVARLYKDLFTNPYKAVFFTFELLHQEEVTLGIGSITAKKRLLTIALTFLNLLPSSNHGLIHLLAWSSAGNAILRRLWRILNPTAADLAAFNLTQQQQTDLLIARRKVATGLGLEPVPAKVDQWFNPEDFGPRAAPNEPPLTKGQSVQKGVGLKAFALGRLVYVGKGRTYTDPYGREWTGPAFEGVLNPNTWVKSLDAPTRAKLELPIGPSGVSGMSPIPLDKVKQRMELANRIAPIEGYLDACRAMDLGLISTGIQQWSAHTSEEFSVLLERFRSRRPDLYDLFIGTYGLQTVPWVKAINNKEPNTASPADIARDNPYAVNIENDLEYFPANVTLFRVEPGKAKQRMTIMSEKKDDRLSFFGGSGDGKYFFKTLWCALVRLASLCSVDYRIVQIHTAVWRMTRLQLENPVTFEVSGGQYTFQQLFPSQFGAALVLDLHINAPDVNRIRYSVRDAIDRVPWTPANPTTDDAWLKRLAVNFMAVRHFPGDDFNKKTRKFSGIGSDNARIRNYGLIRMHDSLDPDNNLSPDNTSFTGW